MDLCDVLRRLFIQVDTEAFDVTFANFHTFLFLS